MIYLYKSSLSRNEMASILGSGVATCSTTCASGGTVTCQGNNCVAAEDIGCHSDTERKDCPSGGSGELVHYAG